MIKPQCDPRISVKQRQIRQTKIRLLIDEQSDQNIYGYNTVYTLETRHYCKKNFIQMYAFFGRKNILQTIFITPWFDTVCIYL